MKNISAGLATHIAGETATLARMWHVTLTNGTEYGFTSHDRDITFESLLYRAAQGYTATDVSTTSELNVDNLEVAGILSSPAITEDDLLAGLWDGAAVEVFLVNYANLAQGKLQLRKGTLGEVRLERGMFHAELRGLTQAYQTVIGELCSPSCRATLGDARCTVNLAPFTVTGTIEAVNDDGVTLYDSSRTEDGPAGGVPIIDISNADPGVVTTGTPHGFVAGQAVMISGVVGPESLNTITVVRAPDVDTFELPIDTSDTGTYPAYVSGGSVVALGSDTGYFDYGLITFDTGANAGLSMEVKAYTTGQIVLQLPMPHPVEVGDTYTLIAGCDKSMATCRDRFSNLVNFRGEPYLPGLDKIVQVAHR